MNTVTDNSTKQINAALLSLQKEVLEQIKEVKDELKQIQEILHDEQ